MNLRDPRRLRWSGGTLLVALTGPELLWRMRRRRAGRMFVMKISGQESSRRRSH